MWSQDKKYRMEFSFPEAFDVRPQKKSIVLLEERRAGEFCIVLDLERYHTTLRGEICSELCVRGQLRSLSGCGCPGAFPLTYRVAIQPEVCIRIGEGWLI